MASLCRSVWEATRWLLQVSKVVQSGAARRSIPRAACFIINGNNYASMGALAASSGGLPGRRTYISQCAVCHGDHRQGSAEIPSLLEVSRKLTVEQVAAAIHDGKGRMPAMPLEDRAMKDLLAYLETDKESPGTSSAAEEPTQYAMTGYRRFVDPDGYPATAPPWGTLNALDLKTGKYLWQIPLGSIRSWPTSIRGAKTTVARW